MNVNTGRLQVIPHWDAASPTSSESDDLLPSLTEAEWTDLENYQFSSWKLTPLRSESGNLSETLPSEFRPFLLSRPICPWHPQYHQTDVTGNHHSWTPSHVGHQTMLPNACFQSPAGQHHTQTPLPHCVFQPPAGQYYTWPLPHGEIHHPRGQHVDQMSSRVKSQLHYHWYPILGASGMVPPSNVTYPYVTNTEPYYHWYQSLGPSEMVPAPSNVAYPYATNTGFPPRAQFHPPANAFTAPPEHKTV